MVKVDRLLRPRSPQPSPLTPIHAILTLTPPLVLAFVQVLIRLKKFSEAAAKAAEERKNAAATVQRKDKQRALGIDTDLSETLATDMAGIDTSILGIVRRVALLLVALSVGGVILWLAGLKYLF